MKIFELNDTQIAIVATEEEFDRAEQVMLEGGRYSSNISIEGKVVKAFVWGITQETKNKLYSMAGQGSGTKVEGVAENTFEMPEKKVDPQLEAQVNAEVKAQNQPKPKTLTDEDKIKAVVQNAKTYCYAAWSQLFQALYADAICPEAETEEFTSFVSAMENTLKESIANDSFEGWKPWLDYIYSYGVQMYKQSKKQ